MWSAECGVWSMEKDIECPPFRARHDLSNFSAFDRNCSFSLLRVLCSVTMQCLNECKLPVNALRHIKLQ